MKRNFFIVLMLLMLFSCGVCQAEDFTLDNTAVDVTETQTAIDIYAVVSIDGELADVTFPATSQTYADMFITGVKQTWGGIYDGRRVNVHINRVEPTSRIPHIRVLISDVHTPLNYSMVNKNLNSIWMYSGDGRLSLKHRYNYFEYWRTAGHELSHILGLNDSYNDEHEAIRAHLQSITNTFWRATDADYYVMLTHKTWLEKEYFRLSDDRYIWLKYMPI